MCHLVVLTKEIVSGFELSFFPGMYSNEGNRFVNLDRPVKAVALDPGYSRPGTNRRYVSGDDKLVLNEKGIFSTNRSYVLHQGEGPIRNIKWRVRPEIIKIPMRMLSLFERN